MGDSVILEPQITVLLRLISPFLHHLLPTLPRDKSLRLLIVLLNAHHLAPSVTCKPPEFERLGQIFSRATASKHRPAMIVVGSVQPPVLKRWVGQSMR